MSKQVQIIKALLYYIYKNSNILVIYKLGCFLFTLAMPDVITKDVTPDHEFIVLACDGES